MSTRKKPQQQLASYFDELLTELDNPAASSENNSVKHSEDSLEVDPPAPSSPPSEALNSQSSLARASMPVSQPSPVIEPPLKHVAHNRHPKNEECDTLIVKSKASGAKPMGQPITQSTSRPVLERGDTVEDVQKEKLQRLLRNLLPDAGTILPEQEAFFENKISAKDSTDEPADELSNESLVAEEPHQWQPLEAEWADNGRPEWAQESFDILLLKVQGVNLAVPLAALDAIYPIEDTLTPIFGQAEWFMGLQKTLIGNVKVINTAQFIMPERYKKEHKDKLTFSVAVNGSGWSLAVDEIDQPLVTYPEDIRWRVNRSKRPWVAGTVTEHMCILLDVPVLARLLNEKNQRTSR